jgi:hypothetical protein
MTNHALRLYALAAAILVFFLSWAAVAARPWANEPTVAAVSGIDPALAKLRKRERELRQKLELARELLGNRAVEAALPPAELPAVQVVETPPVTVTRSS